MDRPPDLDLTQDIAGGSSFLIGRPREVPKFYGVSHCCDNHRVPEKITKNAEPHILRRKVVGTAWRALARSEAACAHCAHACTAVGEGKRGIGPNLTVRSLEAIDSPARSSRNRHLRRHD
eukprot:1192401-Prorocentrum_minimum.AAC.4